MVSNVTKLVYLVVALVLSGGSSQECHGGRKHDSHFKPIQLIRQEFLFAFAVHDMP